MAGDRVCDSWHRFASQCITMDISVLMIAVGCNDTVRRGAVDAPMDLSPALRGRYWEWLLDDAKRNIKTVVVLDILPVRESENDGATGGDGSYNRDIMEYNEQLAKICALRGIPFVRRYDKWASRNLADYYVDFGHPNDAGHQIIADEIYEELVKLGIVT
jgi:lysophospholipase L1-like esterase